MELAEEEGPSAASGMETVHVFKSQEDRGLKSGAHGVPFAIFWVFS